MYLGGREGDIPLQGDMRVAATGRSGVSRGASLTVGVAIPEESGRVRDCSSR